MNPRGDGLEVKELASDSDGQVGDIVHVLVPDENGRQIYGGIFRHRLSRP